MLPASAGVYQSFWCCDCSCMVMYSMPHLRYCLAVAGCVRRSNARPKRHSTSWCCTCSQPAAEQASSAAPRPGGNHVALGVTSELPQCVTDGASPDYAGSSGTGVQFANLERKDKKKMRHNISGTASSSLSAAHVLTRRLWVCSCALDIVQMFTLLIH